MARKLMICTGDVGVKRDDPESMFADVRADLAKADLLFGQCETPLSSRGQVDISAGLPCRCPPETADLLAKVGYMVMSFASNHALDFGRDVFCDTLENLDRVGIAHVGAGRTIAEARKPAIEVLDDGTRVGFLGYCTIIPNGCWATDDRPGCVPMRGITCAYPTEPEQPGARHELYGFPHPEDLLEMLADICALRPEVDILCVSMHGGIHFAPAVVAQYQRYMAKFDIDEGADIILGHHAHIMKPMEFYRGKPVVYCMPNFAFEGPQRFADKPLHKTKRHQTILALNEDTMRSPTKQMPDDSFKSYCLKVHIEGRPIAEVSFSPVQLDSADCHPIALRAGDPRFEAIVEYMRAITADQGFDTVYEVHGDDVFVRPGEIRR